NYWNGCSTGGRQGLMEAQRYPADYDGIVAGAPANNMTHLSGHAVWMAHALHKEPSSFLPRTKLPALHKAVLDACDANDGVKDGVIDEPRRCKFDLKTIECKGADGPMCLTPAQVESTRKIYGPMVNHQQQILFPGLMPGSELGWADFFVTPEPM